MLVKPKGSVLKKALAVDQTLYKMQGLNSGDLNMQRLNIASIVPLNLDFKSIRLSKCKHLEIF